MTSPAQAIERGLLPIRDKPVRFAVGAPDGITSNSWKIWATKAGDIYIACRDNLKEAKVSLHASGRWRMGFTTEALPTIAHLRPHEGNRAWDVWDEPPATLSGAVVAFRLLFPPSELGVTPAQRILRQKEWDKVIYIETAPRGKMTVLTLFVTPGEPEMKHETEPSFRLASFGLGKGRRAQLIAHGEPENDIQDFINRNVARATARAQSRGVVLPGSSYGYFLGQQPDGCRYLVGARLFDRGT